MSAERSERARWTVATGVGALATLGIQHATAEWTPRLALHRVGRAGAAALLPHALVLAAFGCAVALLAGYRRRAAALGCAASLAALHAVVPQTYHNNYYLLWTLLIAVAIDVPNELQWSSSGDPSPGADRSDALAPRLLRLQISIVYLVSVGAKLAHPWWREDGAVVRWIVAERVPASGIVGIVNPVLGPLLSIPAMAAAAQTAVLAFETLLPFMLYSRRWRRVAFVGGAAMHAVMQEWLFPQLFTFLMLFGYYAFAPVGDRGWTLRASPVTHGWLLRAVPALDWLARVRVAPDDARATPSLTSPEGTEREGISALWWLAVLSPASVLTWAALSLLGPGSDTVLTLPRPVMENLLLLGVGVIGLVPGKRPSHSPRG